MSLQDIIWVTFKKNKSISLVCIFLERFARVHWCLWTLGPLWRSQGRTSGGDLWGTGRCLWPSLQHHCHRTQVIPALWWFRHWCYWCRRFSSGRVKWSPELSYWSRWEWYGWGRACKVFINCKSYCTKFFIGPNLRILICHGWIHVLFILFNSP